MLELARFRQPQPARLMLRVLARDGIDARVRDEGEETVLYLLAPEQFDQARRLLDDFLADPASQRFQQLAWEVSEPHMAGGSRPPLLTGEWWRGLGAVTRFVFIVCLLVFASPALFGDSVYRALFFPPQAEMLLTQPWRLFTPMFLHLNVLHILFNLLWWLELGRVIERFQSSFQLLGVTLATAAASNAAQFFATGPNFGGLSGVVYGLLGYLWLYGKTNPAAGYGLRPEIVTFMLIWLVVCMTGLVGNVANTAHFVGLVSGSLLGVVTGYWRRNRL